MEGGQVVDRACRMVVDEQKVYGNQDRGGQRQVV